MSDGSTDTTQPNGTGSIVSPPETAPNYAYWQANGEGWPEEYERRKLVQPDLHVQQFMLAQYMASSGKIRVLEYGCGFGRHLQYLSRLENVDIYGVDQSPTMLAGARKWASAEWLKEHTQQIAPVGRLPFDDGHFDIVYTAEVLVHVRPTDLPIILRELVRVSKWQVLHIEASPGVPVVASEHGGCWNHDIVAAYRDIGLECELLESGYGIHSPWRVVKDKSRKLYTWNSAVLGLLSRFSTAMNDTLASREAAALEAIENERKAQTSRIEALRDEVRSLRQSKRARAEANRRVKSSLAEVLHVSADDIPDTVIPERVGELTRLVNDASTSLAVRASNGIRNSSVFRSVRGAKLQRGKRTASIEWLPARNPDALGNEVWLLGVYASGRAAAEPWSRLAQESGDWQPSRDANAPYGHALVATQQASLLIPPHDGSLTLKFLQHAWSSAVRIHFCGVQRDVELYSEDAKTLEIVLDESGTITVGKEGESARANESQELIGSVWTKNDAAWLAKLSADKASTIAVHVPRWLGVTASTEVLFNNRLQFPRTIEKSPSEVSDREIQYNARLLAATNVNHVVFSGGDMIHLKLAERLLLLRPGVRIDLVWHGSATQFGQNYDWKTLNAWIDAARAGKIRSIATVKKGFEEFFSQAGVRSHFLANYIPTIPAAASVVGNRPIRLGLWLSGESQIKAPYAMIAAASSIEDVQLIGANLSRRALELAELLALPVHLSSDGSLTRSRLLKEIESTHLTLYVTLSECTPMLPLESLSVGVPALIGPTSHLFEDDEYLHRKLVVPYPDRADVIADYIRSALRERTQIVEAYKSWAERYNSEAAKIRDAFLSGK